MNADAPDSPYAPPESELHTPGRRSAATGLVTANPGARLAAVVLNSLFTVLALLPAIVLGGGGVDLFGDDPVFPGGGSALGSAMTVALLVALVVVNLVLIHQGGWTLGKRIVGIRVVTLDGQTCGVLRFVLLREGLFNVIVGVLDALLVVVGTLLWFVDSLMVFSDRGRTLHDRLARTRVVRATSAPVR